MSQGSPNGFIYIQKGDTLSGIASRFPGVRSQTQIANKVRELVRINPHIKDPNRIYAGRVLNLGNTAGLHVVPYETDMEQMEQIFGSDPVLAEKMIENWNSVEALSEVGKEVPPGKGLLTKVGKAIVKGSKEAGVQAAKGKFGNFIKVEPHVWRQVEGQIVNGIRNEVRYLKQSNGALGLVPAGNRAFTQGSKVFVVKPDPSGGFSAFSTKVRAGKDFSKNFLKPAGKVLRVIDLGVSGYNIYQDWGSADQNRTIFKETTKTGVGLAVAGLKTGAALGACALLTVSTGPGGVACFITLYVVLSVAESEGVEWGSDQLYRVGSKLYLKVFESTSPNQINH